jgi:hypothetical protein
MRSPHKRCSTFRVIVLISERRPLAIAGQSESYSILWQVSQS